MLNLLESVELGSVYDTVDTHGFCRVLNTDGDTKSNFNIRSLCGGVVKTKYIKRIALKGEPFKYAKELSLIARLVRSKGVKIWIYGEMSYNKAIEEMYKHKYWSDLLNNTDVYIEGHKYIDVPLSLSQKVKCEITNWEE